MNLFIFDGDKWLERLRQARYERARENTIGGGSFIAAILAGVGLCLLGVYVLNLPFEKIFIPVAVISLVVFFIVYKSVTVAFIFNTLFQTVASAVVGAFAARLILVPLLDHVYSKDINTGILFYGSIIVGIIVGGCIGWNTSKYIRF